MRPGTLWAAGLVVLSLFTACCKRGDAVAPPAAPQPAPTEAPAPPSPPPPAAAQPAPTEATAPPPVREGGCTTDADCGQGQVCEGCRDDDRRCLSGCRKDADCTGGEVCQTVQCIRCPCPRLCGQP